MKRLPALLSLLLFVALCASLAYWLLQWLAPAPRAVAAPPVAQTPMPPLSAAFNLFGGNPQSGAMAIQLRGIIHSGRASDSVAIIAVEGKPARALQVQSEVVPGIQLKQIRARTVILSERGGDREVMLPEFSALAVAAQPAADTGAQGQSALPIQPPAQAAPTAQAAPQPVQSAQVMQGNASAPVASGPGNTGGSAEGGENTVHAPPPASAVPPAMRAPR